MSPESFENALVEKINLAGLIAIPYPQSPAKYYPENSPGEILVRYEGRKPIERDTTGQYNRFRIYAEIVFVTRELRGENGVYAWLQSVFNDLEGFTLDGAAGPLHLEVESFMDENEGTWQFGQKWSCEAIIYAQDNLAESDLIFFNDGFPYKLPISLQ